MTNTARDESKILLIKEEEFSGVLRKMTREGNTLSAVLRLAWDGAPIHIMTKANPMTASEYHVSCIFHGVEGEISRRFSEDHIEGGLGNRILWVKVDRSQKLAMPPSQPSEFQLLVDEYQSAYSRALSIYKPDVALKLSSTALGQWTSVYDALSDDRSTDFLDRMTTRAETYVLKLALLYAVLDSATEIRSDHLDAGLAVWEYCEQSVSMIFGQRVGTTSTHRLEEAIDQSEQKMLPREAINNVFSGKLKTTKIDLAINELVGRGTHETVSEETGGRPRQIVRRINGGESRESGVSTLSQLTQPKMRDVVGYTYGEDPSSQLFLDSKALIGPAGHFVECMSPITEADPAALLIHYLVSFGNQIGKTASILVDGHAHYTNIYAAIIGRTARARKGTAGRRFEQVMNAALPNYQGQFLNGLSTGEGVISKVADEDTDPEGDAG